MKYVIVTIAVNLAMRVFGLYLLVPDKPLSILLLASFLTGATFKWKP